MAVFTQNKSAIAWNTDHRISDMSINPKKIHGTNFCISRCNALHNRIICSSVTFQSQWRLSLSRREHCALLHGSTLQNPQSAMVSDRCSADATNQSSLNNESAQKEAGDRLWLPQKEGSVSWNDFVAINETAHLIHLAPLCLAF